MKESPINPFLSDEEKEKVDFWNNQQVEKVTADGHFTTNLEDEKMEKYLAAPDNYIVPSEKANEAYVDKNVTECQVPKLIACYEESGFHVKDICMDEGVSVSSYEEAKKKIEFDELSFNLITTVNGDMRVKDGIGTDQFSKHQQLTPLEDRYNYDTCLFSVNKDDNVPSNCVSDKLKLFVECHIVHASKTYNSIQNGEGKPDLNPNSLNNSSTQKLVSLNQDPRQTSINVLEPKPFVNGDDQQQSETRSTGSEADEERRRRRSSQSVGILNEIKIKGNMTPVSDNVKPATMNSLVETPPSGPNHHDMGSVVENQLQLGAGESSFSTVSGLITYSGPIASCGNISHRSDGSNSSVRSFAFPILQNEWNSSPVRMGEVDQRRPRKRGGWKQALMCCRF